MLVLAQTTITRQVTVKGTEALVLVAKEGAAAVGVGAKEAAVVVAAAVAVAKLGEVELEISQTQFKLIPYFKIRYC